MKKLIFLLILGSSAYSSSLGQWYVKKYNVPDISLLSKEDLQEAHAESKTRLVVSGCVADVGGLLIIQ